MRKYAVFILAIALALSLSYNVYQKLSFNRLYWFWGTTLTDRLINGHIRIDELVAESNPQKRSALLFDIQERPKEIMTLGWNLDLMLSRVWPFPDTYLGRIGRELNLLTVGVWNRSNAPAAVPGSPSNQIPSLDDLAKLSRVYAIYAEHFPEAVVLSHNPARHKRALQAVHEQIYAEGLDELLPVVSPNAFTQGL